MPLKVTVASTSPEQWSRPLKSRYVYLNKRNMELIGCDCGNSCPLRTGGPIQRVGGDSDPGYLDMAEEKLKAAWNWLFEVHVPHHCHPRHRHARDNDEPAYDEPTDGGGMSDDMMPPDDGGSAPEGGAASAPDTVVQMAPDAPASMPGPSAPPQFLSPSAPSAIAPPVFAVPNFANAPALASSVPAFKAAIKAGNPAAIQTLRSIAAKAPNSPVHAAVLKAVSSASTSLATGKFKLAQPKYLPAIINGDVDSVSDAMTSILSAALAPVVWTANGMGTVSKSIGQHLTNASRKL